MAKHSKEEKELLISSFRESGLSMTKWCHENQLPLSTFNGWINNKETKEIKPTTPTKFVELNHKVSITAPALRITIGNVNIEVDSATDINLLANLIKAVNQANV